MQSPHFLVLTDADEKQGRRVAGQFEEMREVFHRLMPSVGDDAGSPIIVLALRDKKDFDALEPAAYLKKGSLNLAGLFLRAPDKNYILLRLDQQGEHPYATVYHEYTHYMLRKDEEWLPLWLNEGLAEFYQNSDIQEKAVMLGEPNSDDLLYLRQHSLIPLATLLRVDHQSPYYHDEQKGSVFYAESWALTHYIQITDKEYGTHRLNDYAQHLSARQDPVTAAQASFGDLGQLQRALNSYVSQSSFKAFRINSGVGIDPANFPAATVSEAEADAVRADVLVYDDRPKEAEALLDNSLREEPKNAHAHETMGFLRFREHDLPGARKWYGEAVQLDSQSFLAHYYYAVISMQAGDGGTTQQDAQIEASLRTAIKLNPGFAPAYDRLASFEAAHHKTGDKTGDEAHLLNVQAIRLEPENLNYRLNAANVLMEQQQYASAAGVLRAARTLAKTPEEMAQLDSRLQQVENFEAMVEAAKAQPKAGEVRTVVNLPLASPTAEPEHVYPAEAATGPRRTIKGVLHGVACSYPTLLTLSVDEGGTQIKLYSNNYFKVEFTTANYTLSDDLHPCTDLEGKAATVVYGEVLDSSVAGQIFSVELRK